MATRASFKTASTALTAWSYSRYADYNRCPAYFNWTYLAKHNGGGPKASNAAMDRGLALHEASEAYLKHGGNGLPKEIAKHFGAEMEELRTKHYVAEAQWAFDVDLKPVEWFAPDVWLRAKVDAHRFDARSKVLHVVDFKTGKPREEGIQQLELYALAGFAQEPRAVRVLCELWYFDHGTIVGGDMDFRRAKDFRRLEKLWRARVGPMFADRIFAPTANYGCSWCAFAKSKGGPCRLG